MFLLKVVAEPLAKRVAIFVVKVAAQHAIGIAAREAAIAAKKKYKQYTEESE